jgi:hypothetical protein
MFGVVSGNIMVANSLPISERFLPPPDSVLSGRSRLVRFTRRDVAELSRLGIIPEDASTELLDGLVVLTDRAATGEDILRVGKAHRSTVEKLSNLRSLINDDRRHIESQQPLACLDYYEPQPDFMVIRGRLEDLNEDGPAAADAFCVIEVSDSSYERDTGEKLFGYARSGVVQYVIINLRNRTAEVYTKPDMATGRYAPPLIVGGSESISIRVGDDEYFTVRLDQILG